MDGWLSVGDDDFEIKMFIITSKQPLGLGSSFSKAVAGRRARSGVAYPSENSQTEVQGGHDQFAAWIALPALVTSPQNNLATFWRNASPTVFYCSPSWSVAYSFPGTNEGCRDGAALQFAA